MPKNLLSVIQKSSNTLRRKCTTELLPHVTARSSPTKNHNPMSKTSNLVLRIVSKVKDLMTSSSRRMLFINVSVLRPNLINSRLVRLESWTDHSESAVQDPGLWQESEIPRWKE